MSCTPRGPHPCLAGPRVRRRLEEHRAGAHGAQGHQRGDRVRPGSPANPTAVPGPTPARPSACRSLGADLRRETGSRDAAAPGDDHHALPGEVKGSEHAVGERRGRQRGGPWSARPAPRSLH